MWRAIVVFALLATTAFGKKSPPPPPPTEFEIGQHTFFDFGPPFDFYELYLVSPHS